jgi:hypothetical protein
MTHLNKEIAFEEAQDLELEDEVVGTPKLPSFDIPDSNRKNIHT